MKPFIRTPYNYDRDAVSLSTGTLNEDPTLTVESDALDTDINVLVRRFGLTGQISGVEMPPPITEFMDVFDYQSALNLIRAADESFASMDAEVRNRFNNNPAAFVDFCGDPANLPELRKMGLAVPEPAAIVPPEPMPVRIVNPAPEGST